MHLAAQLLSSVTDTSHSTFYLVTSLVYSLGIVMEEWKVCLQEWCIKAMNMNNSAGF